MKGIRAAEGRISNNTEASIEKKVEEETIDATNNAYRCEFSGN